MAVVVIVGGGHGLCLVARTIGVLLRLVRVRELNAPRALRSRDWPGERARAHSAGTCVRVGSEMDARVSRLTVKSFATFCQFLDGN